MRAWQVRLSTVGRVAMFPSEEARREAVLALARIVGSHLLSFSFPDDHGHLIALVADERARKLARSVRLAWAPIAAAPLDPPWCAPFRSRGHLVQAFEYQLGQNEHHGLSAHPATWSGNCFADLVGARTVTGLDLRSTLREALPRYRLRSAFAAVGLPPQPLRGAESDLVRAVGLQRLASAAAAACCAPPQLRGRSDLVVRARVCTARLAEPAGFGSREVADALSVSRATARRLTRGPSDDC